MQIIDGEGRASCRSIDEFDITALLRRNADLFLRFGGHRAAAGFSIDASRLDEVRDRLIADAAERLDTTDLAPTISIDAELSLSDVNRQTIQWLALLGPHGIGNPTPTFLARGVTVAEARAVGASGIGGVDQAQLVVMLTTITPQRVTKYLFHQLRRWGDRVLL